MKPRTLAVTSSFFKLSGMLFSVSLMVVAVSLGIEGLLYGYFSEKDHD